MTLTRRMAGVAVALLAAGLLSAQGPEASAGGVEPLAYSGPAWSPYVAGGLIGVLLWFTMSLTGHPIGASSSYATTAGLIGKAIAPRYTGRLPYFRDEPPRLGWGMVFLVAAIAGSAIAALSGGEWTGRWLPPIWADRFGEGTLWLRALVAFAGGLLMAFGARMAGGCTSGHGISGTVQLNAASWLALICFFIGGVAVAFPLYQW